MLKLTMYEHKVELQLCMHFACWILYNISANTLQHVKMSMDNKIAWFDVYGIVYTMIPTSNNNNCQQFVMALQYIVMINYKTQ